MLASRGNAGWSQLPTCPAEPATATRRSVLASVGVGVEISLVFKSLFIFCHQSGMEEWPALHQSSHLKAKPSGPISAFAQPSLPQPLGGALLSPWSSDLRFLWFSKVLSFFVMKVAWKSGRHSTDLHFSRQNPVVPSLRQISQACRNHQEESRWLPPWSSNLSFVWFQKKSAASLPNLVRSTACSVTQ